MVAAVVAAQFAWACGDFTPPSDATAGLPDVAVAQPSFTRDVQPIFTKRCALGGCHSAASAQFGLILDASHAYDAIVGHASATGPIEGQTTMRFVKPGDHTESWLWRRIQADPALRVSPAYGNSPAPRMPLAATPLTANQITTIMNWIDEGAPRN